jgi:uncharacterized protein (TIGR00369 family)
MTKKSLQNSPTTPRSAAAKSARNSNSAVFGTPLSPAHLARLRAWLIDGIPHSVALNLSVEDMQRGRAVLSLPWAPHLVGNADTGVLAGGAITGLLDSVCGAAVASLMIEIVPFATLDLRIDYNRPAEPRRTVIAEAECYRITPNIAFTRALAHQGDKAAPIAAASGTFMISTRAAPREDSPRPRQKRGAAS